MFLLYILAGAFIMVILIFIIAGLCAIAETDGTSANSSSKSSSSALNSLFSDMIKDGQEYYIGKKCIGLSARKGYEKMPMVGMYYRDLGVEVIGRFEGIAEVEPENKHDKNAIAIYREDWKHLGYLPRGNKRLQRIIKNEGGRVHCYGYIACEDADQFGEPGFFYAEVCVETDKAQVELRNKPYDTTDKFYSIEEKRESLKEWLDEWQDLQRQLKEMRS